ncbi:MAG: serine protease [Mariniblastus sp.]
MNRITSHSLVVIATLFSTTFLVAQPPIFQDPIYPSSTFDNPIIEQPIVQNGIVEGTVINGSLDGQIIDGQIIGSGQIINGQPIQGTSIPAVPQQGQIVEGNVVDGIQNGTVIDEATLGTIPSASSQIPNSSIKRKPEKPRVARNNEPVIPKLKKHSGRAGQGSGLWKWTPRAAYHQSIVEVSTSGGSGTGVVIEVNKDKPVKDGFEGYVVTAWHVIRDDIEDSQIKVTYRNKRRAKGCKVVEYDEDKDIAVLWVWVPAEIKPTVLATKPIQRGDKLELAGLGGGTDLACCVRAFEAFASPPSNENKIFADVPLLPGDSGGPVFNEDHEVVGIISGGWFWWDSGLKTPAGGYIRTTWPARASNVGPIQTMMSKIKNGGKKQRVAAADGFTEKR